MTVKTSERYDQWILTLSGGALAISLTFLEKIAPNPVQWTLMWFLAPSWIAYIVAILAGFLAIDYSRKAIYKQVSIAESAYDNFRSTSTGEKMLGDPFDSPANEYADRVSQLNRISSLSLCLGSALLCLFAFWNLTKASSPSSIDAPKRFSVEFNWPQHMIFPVTGGPPSVSNVTISLTTQETGKIMSDKGSKSNETKSIPPTVPDGSIKGVHTGETGSSKNSYTPPSLQAPIPPPPPPKK